MRSLSSIEPMFANGKPTIITQRPSSSLKLIPEKQTVFSHCLIRTRLRQGNGPSESLPPTTANMIAPVRFSSLFAFIVSIVQDPERLRTCLGDSLRILCQDGLHLPTQLRLKEELDTTDNSMRLRRRTRAERIYLLFGVYPLERSVLLPDILKLVEK
jgi:hypothetical protein